MKQLLLLSVIFSLSSFAKPYPDPLKVISPNITEKHLPPMMSVEQSVGSDVLRVELDWKENETYQLAGVYHETSGTDALIKASQKIDPLGSYKAELIVNGTQHFYASIGTGREFRRLVRTLSFRFPLLAESSSLRLIVTAENPEDGIHQKVIDQAISLSQIKTIPKQDVKITVLRKALKQPAIKFNFYAEGFMQNGEAKFLAAANKAISALEQNLPGSEYFEFKAVFAISNKKLGSYQDLGNEVKIRDSFLGLYFPHWRKFGRWYNVVYPTSETKYRNALAQEPYDYPLALVDDGAYWGVGNYKELTAIPVSSMQFSYLLLHEFGHFMGLNEEYEGGGPTELEFAPKIKEPWSQNITFNLVDLKWKALTEPGISIPTTASDYSRYGGRSKNPVGAYRGGYADSEPRKKSHKPVMTCMMGEGGDFCKVCQDALVKVIKNDLGE